MRIFALAPEQIGPNWEDFRPLVERIERLGALDAKFVREAAQKMNMQIFGVQDDERVLGLVITEITSTPRGQVCSVLSAVGEARKGTQDRLLDEIGKWAASIGCVAVRIEGRKGWLRRFPRFKQTGIVAEWPLVKVH